MPPLHGAMAIVKWAVKGTSEYCFFYLCLLFVSEVKEFQIPQVKTASVQSVVYTWSQWLRECWVCKQICYSRQIIKNSYKYIYGWAQVVRVCAGCRPVWRWCGSMLWCIWWRSQWGSASTAAVHHGRCSMRGTATLQYWQFVYVQHFPHFTQVR